MSRSLARQAQEEHGADQLIDELAALAGMLPPLNRVLEIGSQFGGTAWFWRELAAPNAVASVDIDQSHNTVSGITIIEGDSRAVETFTQVCDWLAGRQLDFLFIDGSHEYPDVKSDWVLYAPLVRAGGVIAFHDIADYGREQGVNTLWREIQQNYSTLSIVCESPVVVTGIGIGVVIPTPTVSKS